MLENLKIVLRQQKRFLAIFLVVVFLPSLILAYFSIRAIHNERYKLQQQTIEQLKEFIETIQTDVSSLIANFSLQLEGLSQSQEFLDSDHQKFRRKIKGEAQSQSFFEQVFVYRDEDFLWFPGLQNSPPGMRALKIPDEWIQLRTSLGKAEIFEFRTSNYLSAISEYRKLLANAINSQVQAWLFSRIARCEFKRGEYRPALNIYRSIIEKFPDLFTESGRPIEMTSRLELLDALRKDGDYETFFAESLEALRVLNENEWSLEEESVRLYESNLVEMIQDVSGECLENQIPEGYIQETEKLRTAIQKKLQKYSVATVLHKSILHEMLDPSHINDFERTPVLVYAFEHDNNEILLFLLLKNDLKGAAQKYCFGLFLWTKDLLEDIDSILTQNQPRGISVSLRSMLSDRIIIGDRKEEDSRAVLSEFFNGNFPPWRIELYQNTDNLAGVPLYKNIFFWTILALLSILIFGSGLIVRNTVQEVNLLNLKSDFIASVSHEFKTPLTSMGAILEHLISTEVNASGEIREFYKILQHDSDRLKRLVKNILDFSKIEEGKKVYHRKPRNISHLVQEEVDSYQKESGISVGIKIDKDIPLVSVDDDSLSQALHNILDNAAKFSPENKVIEVSILNRPSHVEIVVQDQGIGISENEKRKVFNKFYRGKNASQISPTGTGLGLALVKHIMDAHDGEVRIQSQPEGGSRVSLIFPFLKGV
ncbi:ATP-binding protein [Acidobacteriota bacterium]